MPEGIAIEAPAPGDGDGEGESPSLRPWLSAVLGLAIAVSFGINATLHDPYENLVPIYAELAPHIGEGSIGFHSAAPGDAPVYRYRAARYALAPRPIARVGPRSKKDWVVSDLAGPLPGYDTVHQIGDDLRLLRRQ